MWPRAGAVQNKVGHGDLWKALVQHLVQLRAQSANCKIWMLYQPEHVQTLTEISGEVRIFLSLNGVSFSGHSIHFTTHFTVS